MKKKTLLTSVLTIALCLVLVAGGTFALFTTYHEVNIAATAGDVEMTAEITSFKTFSMGVEQKPAIEQANGAQVGTFENTGTATLSGGSLVIDRMTPGDKVELVVTLENASDIPTMYRTIVSSVEDTGLFAGLIVTIDGEVFNGITAKSTWMQLAAKEDPADINVVIELPVEAGNVYKKTGTLLSVAIEGVQGNAPADVVENEKEGAVYVYSVSDLKLVMNALSNKTLQEKEIVLGANLDLAGENWTPVDIWDGDGAQVIFNGNGKTISNMTVDSGSKAGFFGAFNKKMIIQDLTFSNANVTTSGSFAGVVIGHQYGHVEMTNVKVVNSSVQSTNATGIRVGGLVGYSLIHEGGTSLKLDSCSVTNTAVTAYHNVAGLVGTLYNYDGLTSLWSMTNCTVSGNTITVNSTSANNAKFGSPFATEGANWPHTWDASIAYFAGNTSVNNTFVCGGMSYISDAEYYVSNDEQLNLLLKRDGVEIIHLNEGEYAHVTMASDINNLTLVGEGTVVMHGIFVDTKTNTSGRKVTDFTVENIQFVGEGLYFNCGGTPYATVTNLTMRFCSFTSEKSETQTRGDRLFDVGTDSVGSSKFTNIVIQDCTVNGGTQGIRLGALYGNNVISNCVINGVKHNAITLRSVNGGTVQVSGNTITDGDDRAFRIGTTAAGTTVTYKDNAITNTGDPDDSSNYKANTVNGTVIFTGNTVDGTSWEG